MIATIPSRANDAQLIADAMQRFTGTIETVPGFESIQPRRKTDWIDPESKLKRRKPAPPKHEPSERRLSALEELRARKKLPPELREPTMAELALKHGISRSTLQRRLSMGMSMDQALAPVKPSMVRSRGADR